MDLSTYFSRVCVISLPNCPISATRLERFFSNLEFEGWPFRRPKVFRAIDGRKLPLPFGYERSAKADGGVHWTKQRWNGFTEGNAAYGCARSHTRAIEDFLLEDGGKGSLLMLEDDAVLVDGFKDKVEAFIRQVESVDPKWEGLYLGGQHMGAKPTEVDGLLRCGRIGRTHCYAARGEFLRSLYRAWSHAPVHIDWVQENIVPSFKVYAPTEFLVHQGAGPSFLTCRDNPTLTWNYSAPKCVVVLRSPKAVMDELRPKGWHNGFFRDSTTGIDNGLLALVKMTDPVALFGKLKKLLAVYHQETGNIKDGVPVIWHPDIPIDWVQMATKLPVVEIKNATSPEQAQGALTAWQQTVDR